MIIAIKIPLKKIKKAYKIRDRDGEGAVYAQDFSQPGWLSHIGALTIKS